MKKKRLGVKILIGCLAAPFVLVLVLGLLVLTFRAMPIPESEIAPTDPVDAVDGVTVEQLAAEGIRVSDGQLTGRPVPVNLHLEEGFFRIEPADAGTTLRVEGEYDHALYDLETAVTRDDSGHPSFSVRFTPKYSALRRLLSGAFENQEHDNRLTVYIPRGLPIELDAMVSKGESRLELGGLAIRRASLVMRMGDHNLNVGEPNPIEMTDLELDVAMGEFDLENLGNLRPGKITAWGKMGEVDLDIGREISRDTTLYTRMKMGELSIGVPRNAQVKAHSSVFLGESSGAGRLSEGEENPDLPRLDIDAGISLGELRFLRH